MATTKTPHAEGVLTLDPNLFSNGYTVKWEEMRHTNNENSRVRAWVGVLDGKLLVVDYADQSADWATVGLLYASGEWLRRRYNWKRLTRQRVSLAQALITRDANALINGEPIQPWDGESTVSAMVNGEPTEIPVDHITAVRLAAADRERKLLREKQTRDGIARALDAQIVDYLNGLVKSGVDITPVEGWTYRVKLNLHSARHGTIRKS